MNMEKNALVKYTFLKLLLREFGIYIRETEVEKADLAKQCVEIYDTPEEFYLEENQICRRIQGKIWYFSRIRWEEGLKKLEN